MIVWYLLFTTASKALLVSGSSLLASGLEESERRQWQSDMQRLRSQMQEWFQNAFSENQRRQMMSPLEGAFNPSLIKDMFRGQLQRGGGQGGTSDTEQKSSHSDASHLGNSGRIAPVPRASENSAFTLPLGQAPLRQLPHHAHSAAQFAPDQDSPGNQGQPEQTSPSRNLPGLHPGEPDGTIIPRPGRGSLRGFFSSQRSHSDYSSEESRESAEDFSPSRGQSRPSYLPGQGMPGWNRRGGNWGIPGGVTPGQDSLEESQSGETRQDSQGGGQRWPFPSGFGRPGQFRRPPGQNSEDSQGSGQRGELPSGLDRPGQFPRLPRPHSEESQSDEQPGQFPSGFRQTNQFPRHLGLPGFSPPGQRNQSTSAGVPPGFGDHRSQNMPGQRPPASPTTFDQSSGIESFPGKHSKEQILTGQSSGSQGSSGHDGTWSTSLSRGAAMYRRSAVENSAREVASGGNDRGQVSPARQPSCQSLPGKGSFGNSEGRQVALGKLSSSQNYRNRFQR